MDRSKKSELEKRLVMGLLVVFAVSLFLGPLKPKVHATVMKPDRERLAEPEPPVVDVEYTEPAPVLPIAQTVPAYQAQALRDPLASLLPVEPSTVAQEGGHPTKTTSRQPQFPSLALQGLLWGSAEPSAIINGAVYRVGDTVGGATITGIDRRGVMIEFQGITKALATNPTTDGWQSQPIRRR